MQDKPPGLTSQRSTYPEGHRDDVKYTQLTQEQRYQIYAYLKMEHSQTEIAAAPGTHRSTISRELQPNQGKYAYRPKQAHQFFRQRRKKV
ncbi:MAG: helix-turn-helix domain-containing protein [Anaerolineaceae bacterium]|nr:helix-turn-helix domain-containing protein [Anaerolineaceae bacterium]